MPVSLFKPDTKTSPMELPRIGKVKRPLPWLAGLLAAGLVGVGGVGYLTMAARTPKID
jgi:HlyD family secretion protein